MKKIKIKSNTKHSIRKGFFESFLAFINKDISIGKNNSINNKTKETWYHGLALLLESGIDMKTSLELILSDIESKKYKEVYHNINKKVVEGKSLSEAMEYSEKFSTYEFYSIKIGEETGKIIEILKELALYFKNRIKQKRQIISALTYPVVVLLTSVLAIVFMLLFVVPMFEEIFKRFNGELPWITNMIIITSKFIKKNYLIGFLFLVVLIYILKNINKYHRLRNAYFTIILKTPFIGDIILKIYLARLCYSLSLLLGSKVPLTKSISLASQMVSFYPLLTPLKEIEKDLINGLAFHKSISRHEIFPKRMSSLIKVAEEINHLDTYLQKIANQFMEDVDYKISIISNLLEPIIIIILGTVVGLILIAMYLPLFELNSII